MTLFEILIGKERSGHSAKHLLLCFTIERHAHLKQCEEEQIMTNLFFGWIIPLMEQMCKM